VQGQGGLAIRRIKQQRVVFRPLVCFLSAQHCPENEKVLEMGIIMTAKWQLKSK